MSCCFLLSQAQTHDVIKGTDMPECVLWRNRDTSSTLTPTHPSVASLRHWNRRRGPIIGGDSPALRLGLDVVQSLNSTSKPDLWVVGAPIHSVLQDCNEEVESRGIPMTRQYRQSLQRFLTAKGPLEGAGAGDRNKSHCYNSISIDLRHREKKPHEGLSTTVGRGWPPSSLTLLSHQSLQRKQGYMYSNPSDSGNEVGVECTRSQEGAQQAESAPSHNSSWLPPIQEEEDGQEIYCSCFPHPSVTVQSHTAKETFNCPFTIWSQSNSYMGLLGKTCSPAHVTHATPWLPDNTLPAAGSRVFSGIFPQGALQSSLKHPTPMSCKNLMVVGRRPYYIAEKHYTSAAATSKTSQVLQSHAL